jgi:cysteine-rich repeat protein
VGFRCCSTCGNGTIDPGETCDPAPPANSPNCHPLHCGPITCGNGTIEAGEVCDDGNLLPYDGCSPQCQNEGICGDSIIQGGETCDDGNTTGGDGCSALCQIENWVSLINETFTASCVPPGWVVQNGGEGAATWSCCTGSGACAGGNDTNSTTSPSGGRYMMADSDGASSTEWLVEGLVTPAVNLSACTNTRLTFYHDYNDLGAGDFGYVQYSVNGQAGPWTTLVTYTADDVGQVILNVTAETAGFANVAFRFRYDDGDTWAWYWKVDDITVDCLN